MSFRDYLNSKDFFKKINNSLEDINRQMNDLMNDYENNENNDIEDGEYIDSPVMEADDSDSSDAMDNLTDVDDIDSDLDAAQKEAGDPDEIDPEDEEQDEQDDQESSEKPKRKRRPRATTAEQKSIRNAFKSSFFKDIKRACRSFKRISVDKDNGFEIPDDKDLNLNDKSINLNEMNLVSFGYQIPTEVFNQEMDGNLENADKLHMLDDVAVACVSTDYFGVSFFLRNDFVITDTNTDSYAEKIFNGIAEKLKNTNKLTFECFKAAILHEIKTDQTINDDVIVGYMKVYNFANYVSEIINQYDAGKDKSIPIIVSDKDNVMFDELAQFNK